MILSNNWFSGNNGNWYSVDAFKKPDSYYKWEAEFKGDRTFNQIDYINKEYIMAPMKLEEHAGVPPAEIENM